MHREHSSDTALINRRAFADAAEEQRTEAAEARKPHFHTGIGDRVVPAREKPLRQVNPRGNPVLMRRAAKDRIELVNEVRWRQLCLAREVGDGARLEGGFHQQITCAAQATEPFVSQQHDKDSVPERTGTPQGSTTSRDKAARCAGRD